MSRPTPVEFSEPASIDEVLVHPAAPLWLKSALRTAHA